MSQGGSKRKQWENSKMTKKVCLFIIDPQFDFCDPSGTLFVPGANLDMVRLGDFINRNITKIDDIQVTLDSHHRVHVAHAISWVDEQLNKTSTNVNILNF